MPVAKLPSRMTTVLTRLHRAAERTLVPRVAAGAGAGSSSAPVSREDATVT